MPKPPRDSSVYVLAIIFGLCAGWVQTQINDLLVTALLVVASTMLLGALRPVKPWRWIVIVALIIPAMEALAFKLLTPRPPRSELYESLLAFLPAIAGAYGGSVLRKAVQNIREGK